MGRRPRRRWDREEQAAYATRARAVGCPVLMVNVLEDPAATPWPSFGGAMVVSPSGQVLARLPLGREGLLMADVPLQAK